MREDIFEPLDMKDTGFHVPQEKKCRLVPQYRYNAASRPLTCISSEPWSIMGESGGGVGKNGARIISPYTIERISENQLDEVCLNDFHKMKPYEGMGWGLGVSTIFSPAKALTLAPKHSIAWAESAAV